MRTRALAGPVIAVALLCPLPTLGQGGPLRGGAFELGIALGPASFQAKSDIESCRWWGLRVGHRFAPLPGNEKLRIGFRTGFEGCLTDHAEEGRLDLIHVNAGVWFGLELAPEWIVYWLTGVGELLGDTTPGPGDEVQPRFAVHGGPGITWAWSGRFFLDAALMGIVFEGYDLGKFPVGGSTWGLVPIVMLGIQI